jgi:zinc D-Ala-D-Ala dipeptidase
MFLRLVERPRVKPLLDHSRMDGIDNGIQPHVVLGGYLHSELFFVEIDSALAIPEIPTVQYVFSRNINGIVEKLRVHFTRDVEGRHGYLFKSKINICFIPAELLRHFPLYLLLFFCAFSCENAPKRRPLTAKRVFAVYSETPSPKPLDKDTSYLEFVFRRFELVNIHSLDSSILVRLQYSDTNNFLRKNLYDGLRRAYFNCETAWRLAGAQYILRSTYPSLRLVVLDATRPQHIQQLMWDSLQMHPDIKYSYLAPPYETSLHNYGCAVDVTILDTVTNQLVDMGSPYDHFDKISQPAFEKQFLKSGQLDSSAFQNRMLLRTVMQQAGFRSIASEWWHFSICKREEAMKRFQLVK